MGNKLFVLLFLVLPSAGFAIQRTDVLVVGGGASGTTAGIQAARLGVRTMIVEETAWLGGMLTSAGVSAFDGNFRLPSGMFGEFRDSLVQRYGNLESLNTGWVSNILFEPKTGADILNNMALKESKLEVKYNTKFLKARKVSTGWVVTLRTEGKTQTVITKVMIDATELGDVAKACGATYDIGMEARKVCGESIAPEKSNNIIQDLTYVMILKDYGKNMTIHKPANYNPSLFFCTAQSANCKNPKLDQTVWTAEKLITYGKLPNGKYMINWPIEGNDYYVNTIEMSASKRRKALEKAKEFSLCYLYYLQTELGFSTFGLADDEFPTADKLPMIPYYRESRRIRGLVRFNVNHVTNPYGQPEALYRTGIAVGDYPVDHHHKRYPEAEKLPELHFYPIPSYNVPLGALISKNVKDLIVAEKSISVSNLLNGSTRLQPIVMQIGQAAGVLAAFSAIQNKELATVSVRDVQTALLNSGGYLFPYLDLAKDDIHFKAIQRIGSTGILKGIGMNVGWKNETWFRADSLVEFRELKNGFYEFDPTYKFEIVNTELTVNDTYTFVSDYLKYINRNDINREQFELSWHLLSLKQFDFSRKITRKEFAVMLDYLVNPFLLKKVDIYGKFQ